MLKVAQEAKERNSNVDRVYGKHRGGRTNGTFEKKNWEQKTSLSFGSQREDLIEGRKESGRGGLAANTKTETGDRLQPTCILSIMANRSVVWGRKLTQGLKKGQEGSTVHRCLSSSFIRAQRASCRLHAAKAEERLQPRMSDAPLFRPHCGPASHPDLTLVMSDPITAPSLRRRRGCGGVGVGGFEDAFEIFTFS